MNIDLSETELEDIVILLHQNEDEGSYWGRKDYYWKRHNNVLKKIKETLEDGTKI